MYFAVYYFFTLVIYNTDTCRSKIVFWKVICSLVWFIESLDFVTSVTYFFIIKDFIDTIIALVCCCAVNK